MHKILTYDRISPTGLSLFSTKHYTVGSDTVMPDALLLRSHDLNNYKFPSSVLAVARAGVGVNTIPVAKLTELGVPVFNTPGANANAVKELVLAGLLMSSRHLCEAWDATRKLDTNAASFENQVEASKKNFVGFELPGKTLAIIGLGAIGVKVANAARALGMKVIGYDPDISVQRAWELSSKVKNAETLKEALRHADFVSLHLPLNDNTHHLIDASKLGLIPKGGILINCARGGIVHEADMLQALQSEQLRYYVTDFPSVAIQNHARVIALPHLGASTVEAEEQCAVMAVNSLVQFLEHGHIQNAVNFPNINLPRGQGYRIGVSNANVPNMLGQISSTLANANLNILDMINKSRDLVAYTLIDTESPIPKATLDKIRQIPGVLKVQDLKNGECLTR